MSSRAAKVPHGAANVQSVDSSLTRAERKQRTRQAILETAFRLMRDSDFPSLSLRQVAREVGIVPTAFYRHFADMEELGLALVEESTSSLRHMLRLARRETFTPVDVIARSVDIFVGYVHEHREHMQFILRERFTGMASIRRAIQWELRLFVSELATDLRQLPPLNTWPTDDLVMMSQLMVSIVVTMSESLIEKPAGSDEEAEVIATAKAQMRLVVLGVANWRSSAALER